MKKCFSILVFLFLSSALCNAQENRPGTYFFSGPSTFVRPEPPATQTQLFNDAKKYGYNPDGTARVDVKGSPFWNDEWCKAEMFDFMDSSYGFYSVKIDMAEGLIYFINKRGAEMVVNEGEVKKIIIYDSTDNNKIKTVFRINVPEIQAVLKQKKGLVQEMNQGNYKLLKLVTRNIESADSLFGTQKRYFYKDRNEYFIQKNKQIEILKRLSKDNFLEQLPSSSKYAAWIKEQNLNFKKEKDFIIFLDYYNSQYKSN